MTMPSISSLDVYNAMSDAENGFDSGALDRLTGNIDDDSDSDEDPDPDEDF